MSEQLNLDGFWTCPRCEGTGSIIDRETMSRRPCKVCFGTGHVPYDPADRSFGF